MGGVIFAEYVSVSTYTHFYGDISHGNNQFGWIKYSINIGVIQEF